MGMKVRCPLLCVHVSFVLVYMDLKRFGIEAAEVVLANLQKAVNVVEAQVEGYDPREIGLDVDADISIDDLSLIHI